MKDIWNWLVEWWPALVIGIPIVLAFAYAIAKRTPSKKDDVIVENAIGFWGEIVKFVNDMRGAFKKPEETKQK